MKQRSAFALASLTAAVATLLSGCVSSADRHGSLASATLRRAVFSDVIDAVMPSSGITLIEGQSTVYAYPIKVTVKVMDKCLVANHLPGLPAQPGPNMAGAIQFPNLGYIKSQQGFGLGVVVKSTDPMRGMTVSRERAYSKAVKACSPRLPVPAITGARGARLSDAWIPEAFALMKSSAIVRSANLVGEKCSDATQFPASSYESEEVKVGDAAEVYYRRGEPLLGRRTEKEGAEIFLRCFGRAVDVTDALLGARRHVFLIRHADGIRLVQRETWNQIRWIEGKYHVPFPSGLSSASA
jgi:hypothetical protein